MKPLLSILDHLVYATSDLDIAIFEVEQLLGVRAVVGGQHPSWRTKNALLSLGTKVYLEIMGPDRSQPESNQPRLFGIDSMSKPRLVTWVARADNIQSILEIAKRQKLDLGDLQERSRQKPDGSTLKWTMTDPTKDREEGIIPYFIDWSDSPHPAESSPKGCKLMGLEAFHPEPRRVNKLLRDLGIDFEIQPGPIELRALIECPKGQVILR